MVKVLLNYTLDFHKLGFSPNKLLQSLEGKMKYKGNVIQTETIRKIIFLNLERLADVLNKNNNLGADSILQSLQATLLYALNIPKEKVDAFEKLTKKFVSFPESHTDSNEEHLALSSTPENTVIHFNRFNFYLFKFLRDESLRIREKYNQNLDILFVLKGSIELHLSMQEENLTKNEQLAKILTYLKDTFQKQGYNFRNPQEVLDKYFEAKAVYEYSTFSFDLSALLSDVARLSEINCDEKIFSYFIDSLDVLDQMQRMTYLLPNNETDSRKLTYRQSESLVRVLRELFNKLNVQGDLKMPEFWFKYIHFEDFNSYGDRCGTVSGITEFDRITPGVNLSNVVDLNRRISGYNMNKWKETLGDLTPSEIVSRSFGVH